MLHLFDKVYLEFDEKIDINYDRVVISEQYGKPMANDLNKIAYGELLAYGTTYNESLAGSDIVQLIKRLKNQVDKTGKKVIIYCDKEGYKTFISQWYKLILPKLDLESFTTLMKFTLFNERSVSNTQLSSNYAIKLQGIWEDLGDLNAYWNTPLILSETRMKLFKSLDLSLSYEFLVASYLAGSNEYKDELKNTMHMFMRRWFKEAFTDNRQMVIMNAGNHAFQKAFDFYPHEIDVTSLNPLEGIEALQSYADPELWVLSDDYYTGIFGTCKIEGISQEKLNSLKETMKNVYEKYEGMQINNSIFDVLNWVDIAARDEITDSELDEILDYIVESPFDTNLVPRFDFQNVNFPLFVWFLRQKYEGKDLSKFILA